MTREQLKERVRRLPMQPGVYMHKDKTGRVIYVGKAKLLRNRVANYFQPPERLNAKTRQLVSHIDTFDIIVTESEFEALVLENSMIKKYQPKYNILLKDDKGYPYIRLDTTQDYPRFTVVSRPAEDGARYFGPYMGRKAAFSAIDTISEALHLATCSRVFPRDIGKDRPCLNQHLGRCCAPCTGKVSAEEYRTLILQAASIFEGGAKQLERELTEKMNEAAEELQFERAADLRDRLRAIQKLGTRQHVVAGAFAELDAIAFVQGQTRACVCVLHYGGGSLQSKEYTLFHLTGGDPAEVLSAFVKQYYAQRGAAPKTVLLSHEIEDADAAGEYLSSLAGRKAELAVPQRGERRVLTRLAEKNAYEEIERREKQSERRHKSLELLQSVTGMAALPLRLEAYDISNFAGQDTVGSMIVFVEGQPKKSDRLRRERAGRLCVHARDADAPRAALCGRGREIRAAAERLHDRRRSGSRAHLQGGARLVRAVGAVLRHGQGRPSPYPCAHRPGRARVRHFGNACAVRACRPDAGGGAPLRHRVQPKARRKACARLDARPDTRSGRQAPHGAAAPLRQRGEYPPCGGE